MFEVVFEGGGEETECADRVCVIDDVGIGLEGGFREDFDLVALFQTTRTSANAPRVSLGKGPGEGYLLFIRDGASHDGTSVLCWRHASRLKGLRSLPSRLLMVIRTG